MQCRTGDDEVVRRRLRKQGRLILAIDAVRFDEVSPRLYVVRETLSEEVLYAERIEQADTERLKSFLERVKTIGVPIAGVVTDKEHALVAAVEAVFPDADHQLCQTHYLKNLISKEMESDLTQLGSAVRETVQQVHDIEKTALKGSAVSQEEKEVAAAICRGVRAVGKSRAGDKLVDPIPLKRYERLTEITGRLQNSLAEKAGEWPVLTRILTVLLLFAETSGELARRLGRQVEVIRRIAHILHTESSGRQVRRLLRTYLNRLEREAPNRGRGAARGRFIRHVIAVSDRFWKGLFACYDNPDVPNTNNELEQFLGSLKQHQRRVHGRKSTAGGPLETCAPIFLEVWSRLDEHADLLALLQDLPEERLEEVLQEIERLGGPSRERRSIARDPMRHIEEVLSQWNQG